MSAGCRIRRADGSIKLSIEGRITRLIGYVDIPGTSNYANGSINDPALETGDPWWYLVDLSLGNTPQFLGFMPPDVSVAGAVLSWVRPSGVPQSLMGTYRIFYGVY